MIDTWVDKLVGASLAVLIISAALLLLILTPAIVFYPTWCQYLPEPGRCVVSVSSSYQSHSEYAIATPVAKP